jgi:hypothetical protein
MNILIYRTVRPEEMGYVVNDVKNFFKNYKQITIITRSENQETMLDIRDVDNVVTFDKYSFDVSNIDNSDKKRLQKIDELSDFSLVIIPTSGNLESYNNVVKFNKKVFKCNHVFFHTYPKNFFKVNTSLFTEAKRALSFSIALIMSLPSLIIYGLYIPSMILIKKLVGLFNRNT